MAKVYRVESIRTCRGAFAIGAADPVRDDCGNIHDPGDGPGWSDDGISDAIASLGHCEDDYRTGCVSVKQLLNWFPAEVMKKYRNWRALDDHPIVRVYETECVVYGEKQCVFLKGSETLVDTFFV